MSHFKASAFSVGDRVVVGSTGQTGTVEYIEPGSPISGQVRIHVRIDECPWKLLQPRMSLQKHEAEGEQ